MRNLGNVLGKDLVNQVADEAVTQAYVHIGTMRFILSTVSTSHRLDSGRGG